MNLLFDTSVLVAAMVTAHSAHDMAHAWLRRIQSGEHHGYISQHSLAELYAVLTTLPVRPRISAKNAIALIDRTVLERFEVVALDTGDYVSLLHRHALAGRIGGSVYDAVIAQATRKAGTSALLSANARDFRALLDDHGIEVIAVSDTGST